RSGYVGCRRERVVNTRELCVVPGIEELGAELQLGGFRRMHTLMGSEPGKFEVFEQRDVPCIDAGATNDVAGRVTERARLLQNERVGIEVAPDGALTAIEIRVGNQVGPLALLTARAGHVVIDAWSKRQTG